jgi:hypothetical protein
MEWDWMRLNFIERCVALVVLMDVLATVWVTNIYGTTWPTAVFVGLLLLFNIPLLKTLVKFGRELYG